MEVGLGWLGIGVGAIGVVFTYLMAAGLAGPEEYPDLAGDRRRAWLSAGLTLVLTLLFWGVSMRRTVPFSPGQTLGYGFLIGGIAGALACILAFRFESRLAAESSYRRPSLAANSMAFFGLASVSLTYLIFHGFPQMALIGFSIGTAMAAVLRYFTQSVRSDRSAMLTELWAIFTITLAATIVLAVYHFDKDSLRMWWALPILIGATVCIASYVAIEVGAMPRFGDRPAAPYVASVLVAAALTIGLAAIYAAYVVQSWQLLGVVAVGIGVFALIAWLVGSFITSDNRAGGLEAASASVLLVIAGAVVAFKVWSGLGIGIGLIAAWVTVIPAMALRNERESTEARALLTSLALGLAIVLFRLFVETYRSDLGSADLRIHYTFVGALLGAIAPFIFASSLMRLKVLSGRYQPTGADLCALSGVATIGFLAAASPLVLFAVWQIKAVLGFAFGLIAAQAFLLLVQLYDSSTERRELSMTFYSISLLVIGAQLVAIQFVRPLVDWESTRATRVWVLVIAAAIALVWLLVTGIAARRSAR
ncbi:MAG: hypothetical protein ACYC64_11250 [Armatimonadota bacterium]